MVDLDNRRQIERLKAMTPGERWQAAKQLYWSMRRLKAAYLRSQHPEWSEQEVARATRDAFRYVRDD